MNNRTQFKRTFFKKATKKRYQNRFIRRIESILNHIYRPALERAIFEESNFLRFLNKKPVTTAQIKFDKSKIKGARNHVVWFDEVEYDDEY